MKWGEAKRGRARNGLRALVGSPARIKEIEDGKSTMKCPVCRADMKPVVGEGGEIGCGKCGANLYPRSRP